MRLRKRIADNKFEVSGPTNSFNSFTVKTVLKPTAVLNREIIKTCGLDEDKKYYL